MLLIFIFLTIYLARFWGVPNASKQLWQREHLPNVLSTLVTVIIRQVVHKTCATEFHYFIKY